MSAKNRKSPYTLLKEIEARSQQSAVARVTQEHTENAWRGIGFLIEGQRFVAPMGEVDEVIHVPLCTKIPGVQPWLNGVSNVRGRLLSVVDLGVFFGQKSAASSRKSRVLTVKQDEIYAGVIIQEVLGLQSFSGGMSKEGADLNARFRPYVEGQFVINNENWTVFSLFKLVQAQAFLQVAV